MNTNTSLQIFYKMMKARLLEEVAVKLKERGLIADELRLSLGQEAVAAAVCALSLNDVIFVPRRNISSLIAANVPSISILSELCGLKEGMCGGKGGLDCAAWSDTNVFGPMASPDSSLMRACGTALSFSLQGLPYCVLCIVGDSAAARGDLYTALNYAALNNLRIVFYVENNGYAGRSRTRDTINVSEISRRTNGFEIPGFTVDGNDTNAVYEAVDQAISFSRQNRKPALIEAMTYRLAGETYEEIQSYRSEEEVNMHAAIDPIEIHTKYMTEAGIGQISDFLSMREAIQEEIDAAVDNVLALIRERIGGGEE